MQCHTCQCEVLLHYVKTLLLMRNTYIYMSLPYRNCCAPEYELHHTDAITQVEALINTHKGCVTLIFCAHVPHFIFCVYFSQYVSVISCCTNIFTKHRNKPTSDTYSSTKVIISSHQSKKISTLVKFTHEPKVKNMAPKQENKFNSDTCS